MMLHVVGGERKLTCTQSTVGIQLSMRYALCGEIDKITGFVCVYW